MNEQFHEEQALVIELKHGKEEAYIKLFELYERKVFGLAFRFVREKEDAEEVLQDTFTAVFRRIKDFRSDSKLSSWIYRIAVNYCLMKIRSRNRARKNLEPNTEIDPEAISDQGRFETKMMLTNELKALQRFIDELPLEYRSVLVLRELNQLSTDETSIVMRISESAVKARLYRARLYLRSRMVEVGLLENSEVEKLAA